MQDHTLIDCCIIETLKSWTASQAPCALRESEKQRIHGPLCEYLMWGLVAPLALRIETCVVILTSARLFAVLVSARCVLDINCAIQQNYVYTKNMLSEVLICP